MARSGRNLREIQLTLLQDLLAAPGSQEGWHAFLLHLCDALNGSGASFIAHDLASTQVAVSVNARSDPAALAEYNQHWFQFDPWAHSPQSARLRSGSVVVGDELINRTDMRRTAYYNDFGRHYGVVHCLAGMIEVSPHAMSCVSINGSERRAPFDAKDAALMSALMPPIERALNIHKKLAGAELMSANASAVLDRLPHGVLLLAKNGAVLTTNRAADDILRRRDGLTLERGELRAATVALTNQLRTVIDAALRPGESLSLERNYGVTLPRPSGLRPLAIVVAPLPRRDSAGPEPAVATTVVFVTDPDRTPVPDADVIRSMFNLTRAEAHLVQCLAAGYSLEQAATHLELRPDTVRSRLKIIFQKTNTHRQADLVRLVLTSAASLVAR